MANIDMKKQDLHGKLSEQKREYDQKMKIIDEIRRDKERHEERERLFKEKQEQERAETNKYLAQNFKD